MNQEKLSSEIKLALEQARLSKGWMLYGSQTDLTHALVHPAHDGGTRMSAFEKGELTMAFTVVDDLSKPFDPQVGIVDPSGILWIAIATSAAVGESEKLGRLWESWCELFEAMPLIDSDVAPGAVKKSRGVLK